MNLRLTSVAGRSEYLIMADTTCKAPIPKGRPSNWFAAGELTGLFRLVQTPSHAAVPVAAPHTSAVTSIVDACGGQGGVGESALDSGPGHVRADDVCGLHSRELVACSVTDEAIRPVVAGPWRGPERPAPVPGSWWRRAPPEGAP
jgi:hypothetical protein